jgi:LmbE family N-acetylglucosaminyl deacetylase
LTHYAENANEMTPMALPPEALDRSVLVVAHPDDEVLWFSSILDDVAKIVIVFDTVDESANRRSALRDSLADHPLAKKIASLGIARVRSHNRSRWPEPEATVYGLRLEGDPGLDAAYASQHPVIREALRPQLQQAGNVFTHNPWGEYGHEDHVQVSHCVTALAGELGATVWHSNYVSGKSSRLMRRYVRGFRNDYRINDIDAARARAIADPYFRHGTWTYDPDYAWFPSECFIEGPLESGAEATVGTLFPVNYLRVPFDPIPARAPRPGLPSRIRRRLRRVLGLDNKAPANAATR